MKLAEDLYIIHNAGELLRFSGIDRNRTFSVWFVGEDIFTPNLIEAFKTSSKPLDAILDRYSFKHTRRLVRDACMVDLHVIMNPLFRLNEISYDPHDKCLFILQVH